MSRGKLMMRYVYQSREISRIAVVILWKWFCIKDSGRAILLAFCGPYLSPKYIARAISIHYYQHYACVAYERRIDLLIVVFSSFSTTHTCVSIGIFSFSFYRDSYVCDLSENSYPRSSFLNIILAARLFLYNILIFREREQWLVRIVLNVGISWDTLWYPVY